MAPKYLYFDVILRTSIFPMLFGVTVAWHAGVLEQSASSALAFLIALIGIILIQGVIEHGLDVLKDKGGFSAFRYHADQNEQQKITKSVRIATLMLIPLALMMIILWRPWELLIGIMAYRAAHLYVSTHNEWYSVFGFMLSFSAGYFAVTNAPTTAWVAGAMLTGFIMKASQAMYRLDDYFCDDFLSSKTNMQRALIQYYRNIFRNTLHLIPLLATAIILFPEVTVNLSLWYIYLAGGIIFAYQVINLKDKTRQEVNMLPLFVAIVAVEIISGNISVRYLIASAITWYCFLRFWKNRHAMCNIFYCSLNPVPKTEVPR